MPKSQKRSNSKKQLSKKSKRNKPISSKKQKRSKSKKSKKIKRIKLMSNVTPQEIAKKCKVAMNDSKLTALCMSCLRKSNKQITKSLMSPKNRVCKKTKYGRPYILGYCAKCNSKMAKLL